MKIGRLTKFTPEELDKIIVDAFHFYGKRLGEDRIREGELVDYFMRFKSIGRREAEDAILDASEDDCILSQPVIPRGEKDTCYEYIQLDEREAEKERREEMAQMFDEKMELWERLGWI